MNKLLLLIFILFSFTLFSQATKIKVKKEKEKPKVSKLDGPSIHGTLDFYYGSRIFTKNYYKQLNTTSDISPRKPPAIVGIGYSGYLFNVGSGSTFLMQMNYYKILPNKISIEDSLSTKLSGFVYGFGIGKGFYTQNRKLSVTAYLGFNTGRTTLSKNEFITQKNQFFSPKITIQPKAIIKGFVISLIAEAEYDVSNPAWKQTFFERKEPHLLLPFHQTCFTGVLSIGWWLR
ncbi:MAG: hypothetical protein V4677_08655 [Bacteroidota bacterium]